MPTHKLKTSSRAAYGYTSANKDRRKVFHVRQKKARDVISRDEKFRRKREEEKNPSLREERLAKNKPKTLDSKRTWDDTLGEDGDDMLGLAVDLETMRKRRRTEELEDDWVPQLSDPVAEDEKIPEDEGEAEAEEESEDSDADSMLEDDEIEAESDDDDDDDKQSQATSQIRAPSPVASTVSTKMDLTPEALQAKFPTLFEAPREPKIPPHHIDQQHYA